MNRLNYLLFFGIVFSLNTFAADYEDDAAGVDMYVTGNMVNEAMNDVNFLICFMNKTNLQDFVQKGSFVALVDEKKCKNQTGADATAEAAAATPKAANDKTSSSEDAAEQISYTPATLTITSTGTVQSGKGWVEPEMDPQAGMKPKVYMEMEQTAGVDVAAGVPFGNFEFWYEMLQEDAIEGGGMMPSIPANTPVGAGYLKAEGQDVTYFAENMMSGPQAVFADFQTDEDVEGVFSATGSVDVSGSEDWMPANFIYQFKVDSTQKVYCQKFIKAQVFSYADMANEPTITAMTEAEVTALGVERVYLDTYQDFSNMVGESCFYTDAANSLKHVWRYGTYDNATGVKYDLATSAFPMRADADVNGLSQDLYGYAAYWGVHVDEQDKSLITENTIWKNDGPNKADDTNEYKLVPQNIEVMKKDTEFASLKDLDGYSASMHFEENEEYWAGQLGKLGDGSGADSGFGDFAGNCTAAGACREYQGKFSFNATTPSQSHFTFTHGMDFNKMGDPRVELTTPKKFTIAEWTSTMKKDWDWDDDGVTDETEQRGFGFWSNDVRQFYDVPFLAMENPSSTVQANMVRSAKETKIELSSLEGKSFICIEQCLDTTAMNTVLQTAVTQAAAGSTATIQTSPYYPIGAYHTTSGYYDWDENGVQDGWDQVYEAGDHFSYGLQEANAKIYTVSSGLIAESVSGTALAWSDATKTAVSALPGDPQQVLRGQRAITKPSGFKENWEEGVDWAIRMGPIVENTAAAISEIECAKYTDTTKGYERTYPGMADDGTTANKRYCQDNFWSGKVQVSYEIRVKIGDSYQLTTAGSPVLLSQPKTFELIVPDGITDPEGTSIAGKKYRLEMQGFGELHGIPGTIFNQCTGENLGDVYVENWTRCFRYISDFTIPDGTTLVDTTDSTNVIKVRALNGDEFLKKASSIEGTFTYGYDETNLPDDSVLKSTALPSSADYVGATPTTGLLNDGSASVIHGETTVPAAAP